MIQQAVSAESNTTPSNRNFNLSTKELDVLGMLAEGHKIKKIAELLDLSESAVKKRINTARKKLFSENAIQCVVRADRLGLLNVHAGNGASFRNGRTALR